MLIIPLLLKIVPTEFKGCAFDPKLSHIYRAPETFCSSVGTSETCEIGSKHTDVYSFGILMYIMFIETSEQKVLQQSSGDWIEKIQKHWRPIFKKNDNIPQSVRIDINKLISKCWSKNRPSFDKIIDELVAIQEKIEN